MNLLKYSLQFIFFYPAIILTQPGKVMEFIKVDQFGYLPLRQKIAIISNPVTGFNSAESFTPANFLQVRSTQNNRLIMEGEISQWNDGEIHDQSGDQVWWFDFSSVTAPGNYYIYDPSNDVASFSFRIDESVYRDVLKQAIRTFYYQRCGLPKEIPHAHGNWTDIACHLGPRQDLDCRLISNRIPATSRDLSGGWHDAGDYNKYVNYAFSTLHDLLFAFEDRPGIWTDDLNIPESGNGIPDLLDEIKWELDWLLKMQQANGSVLHKVSAINWDDAESPPSKEGTVRCYAPATASATISACGVYAHAAIVFGSLREPEMMSYSATLATAALLAWDWLENNPDSIPSHYDNWGFQNAGAELSEYTQQAVRTVDAAYLFALTGEPIYRDYFDNNYTATHLFTWEAVHYIEDDPTVLDGLLYYSRLLQASGRVSQEIYNTYRAAMQSEWNDIAPYYDYLQRRDAYRAYLDDYAWGSNQNKTQIGTMLTNLIEYQFDFADASEFYNAAAGFIHYLHGVNPLALVYLSNMREFGAENSVPEFYHLWFADGTRWDNIENDLSGPAPGFLPGGPNENYVSPGSGEIIPPENQPPQKSYKSWNTSNDNSWEITENQITYQASYIRLLSKFADAHYPASLARPVELADNLEILENYPNPFNTITTILFNLPTTSEVVLTIFNINGQNMEALFSGKMEAGEHRLIWDARSFSSGIYFCNIVTKQFTDTIKIISIK